MPTSFADRRPAPEVIDLLSSDDEEEIQPRQARTKRLRRESADQQAAAGAGAGLGGMDDFELFMLARQPALNGEVPLDEPRPAGQFVDVDGEQIFIPDEVQPPQASTTQQPGATLGRAPSPELQVKDFTLDFCLQAVLGVFPDVSHEHVTKLYEEANEVTAMNLSANLRLANVMESMISNRDYPKQQKQPLRKKRRLEDEVEDNIKIWETDKREVAPVQLKGTIAAMLKADFPEIPKQQIAHEVARHKHLYQTYLALARLKDTDDGSKKWRGRASLSDLATADTIATNCGWAPMTEELKAARARVKDIRRQRVIDEVNKKAEQENLQRAIDNNETSECQVCFDDLPMNRQIHCDGPVAHFTCFSCAELYIKTEVGDARCRVECTAGCGAAFKRSQLYMLSDKPLLAKLEKLQQEKDIRDAGLEGLEECPMCIDFKIILGPIEEDSEFRCGNPECEQVSCRRCKAASHIPLSCEEHAKENKISTRHRIEERMTEALIRSCNKCKKKFIKDFGCNKMSCSSCGNLQCYCCSESITDYRHFDQMSGGAATGQDKTKKCPLYDNSEARHEREVEEAEVAARKEVMEENPDITQDDLDIKVSDAVKKSTAERVRRAGPAGLGAAEPGPVHGGDIPGPFALHALFPRLGGERANLNEAGDNAMNEEAHRLMRQRMLRNANMLHLDRARRQHALARRNMENAHPPNEHNRADGVANLHRDLLAGRLAGLRARAAEHQNQRMQDMQAALMQDPPFAQPRAAVMGVGADHQYGQPIRRDFHEHRQVQPGGMAMQDEHDIPAEIRRARRLERNGGMLQAYDPFLPAIRPQPLANQHFHGLADPFIQPHDNINHHHRANNGDAPNNPLVAGGPQAFPPAFNLNMAAPYIALEAPRDPLNREGRPMEREFAEGIAAHRAARDAFAEAAGARYALDDNNNGQPVPQAIAANDKADAEQQPRTVAMLDPADHLYEADPMDPWGFNLALERAARNRDDMDELLAWL